MAPTSNAKASPLAWPKDRPRTKSRTRSKFGDRSVDEVYKLLQSELGRLAAGGVVVSTNIPLKPNGEPYSEKTTLPDPGVAVYFRMGPEARPYCLPCDQWDLVEDNLYAVVKHIDAMRGMERWGVGSVEQAFAGFKMLTASTKRSWWEVLGLEQSATPEQVDAKYRNLARDAHPDQGGSPEKMSELNVARDEAKQDAIMKVGPA